jgi:hypothetical protein
MLQAWNLRLGWVDNATDFFGFMIYTGRRKEDLEVEKRWFT